MRHGEAESAVLQHTVNDHTRQLSKRNTHTVRSTWREQVSDSRRAALHTDTAHRNIINTTNIKANLQYPIQCRRATNADTPEPLGCGHKPEER